MSTKESAAPTSNGSAARRLAEAAHAVVDETAEKAEAVEKKVRTQAAEANEKLEASQEAAIRTVESSIERLEGFVKSRPVVATGAAFAAGILATALLRR